MIRDSIGRTIEVLRVSVTDRCNFRCVYCMPEQGVPFIPHSKILRYEEILEVVKAAIQLGITRIRLTGGEPLVRSGIVHLVRLIAALQGLTDLAMTTNGSLLAPLAQDLVQAGLKRINISLDTLNPQRFKEITRGGTLEHVLEGIHAAKDAGLSPVKLNIVVKNSEEDSDAQSVEQFALQHGFMSRRIQQMDIRRGVFNVVENSDRGNCKLCNRLRLTSDGFIRSCLLSDLAFDVRELGPEKAIKEAILQKPVAGGCTNISYMGRVGG